MSDAAGLTCGIVIYDADAGKIRTCHAKATTAIVIRGDHLFGTCQRHKQRIDRAFPELRSQRAIDKVAS